MNSRGSLGRTSATDPKPILLLKSLEDVRFMKKLARSLSRMRRNRTGDSVAASTNADHNALQLLSNHFANLAKWASDVVAERQALNGARTVDPNALQNDPVVAKISNCGKFLSTMLVSGIFVDNSSCD